MYSNTQKCIRIHKSVFEYTKVYSKTHNSVFEHTKVYSNTQKCNRIHKNVLVCLAPVVSSFRRKLVTYIAVCQVKSAITRKCVVTPKNGGALYSPLFAHNPVSSRPSGMAMVSRATRAWQPYCNSTRHMKDFVQLLKLAKKIIN